MEPYSYFWGKAAGALDGQPAWHPLAYHSLDVAAVADALLQRQPRKLAHLARLLGTTSDNARRLIVCLVALHDVGKFANAFQCKREDAWPVNVLGRHAVSIGDRHDQTGYDLRDRIGLSTLLEPALTDWTPQEINSIWAAVAGHHGQPVKQGGRTDVIAGMKLAGIDAAAAFAKDVAALYAPIAHLPEPEADRASLATWAVAGLTNLADWIGSNRDWFPYRSPGAGVAEYWAAAKTMADAAIQKSGILAASPNAESSAAHLLPEIAATLSPLQEHVTETILPEGPLLAIIEDVTGSGKTEAALLLAARLLADKHADGLFFALPTMATANAMYERLAGSYRRLFTEQSQPSLVLAHGKRSLNKGFVTSLLDGGPVASLADADAQGNLAGAACAAWIADDRRKSFLADVGIGTIDQALLGVLPSRHQALRLWGLADRVLVIDEAHAYDAYMSRELERLLEFHAALGGSAIVLSATLPQAQRSALERSFASGLGERHNVESTSDYPLMTLVSEKSAAAQPLASRKDRTRTLPVRRISGADEAISHIVEMAGRGAAVAWIRNAVDDAIEACDALRAHGLDPVLLHARFAMGDRLAIEDRVRATLGRRDTTGKRRGFVLVGTQILEQSLDYDVDAMVIDLAPIDLMIQRAGRLWRHAERTGRPVEAPELLVLSPNPESVTDKDWYRSISSRAAAVYAHHGLVWRSARELFAAGAIDTPGGVRGLVERVYSADCLDDIPEPLQRASKEAEGKRTAERSIATSNLLDLRKGYGGNVAHWTSDTITPTRLGDPVTVFRLGRIEGDRIVPLCAADDGDLRRSWALSEVSLSRRKATGVPTPVPEMARLVEAAKASWSEWEREQPLLLLDRDGDGWCGAVAKTGDIDKIASYHARIGLRLVAT